MKKLTRSLHRSLGVVTGLLLFSLPAFAQPAWPPNASTAGDHIGNPASMTAVHANQRINMDMFSYYTPGWTNITPPGHVVAYAFDDVPSGSTIPVVTLVVWDAVSNVFVSQSISNATQPDVVLLDDPNNQGEDFYAALVYEQGGQIKLQYIEIDGAGSGILSLTPSTAMPISDLNKIADNPHIDAAPDFASQILWPGSAIAPLYGFYHFAITWHEYDPIATTDEIWTAFDNNFLINAASTTLINTMKVDDGIISDVAFARVSDINAGQDYYNAYYIYENAGSVYYADVKDGYGWYTGNPTINTHPAIESGTFTSPPRIDASNVHATNNPRTVWEAVVGIQNSISLNQEIHSYGFNGMLVTIINYSDAGYIQPTPPSPLSVADIYTPVVAAASNDPAWTAGAAFAGNTDYMLGFFLDRPSPAHDFFLGATQGAPGFLSPQMGFDIVNNGGVDFSTITVNGGIPALALSYGTNTGYASTAAFCDGSNVYAKKPKNYLTSPPMFKPTEIVKMHIPRGLSVYPNPATNWIGISGLETGSSYTINDVLGRHYAQGTMGKTIKTIDISALPAGMYTVSVDNGKEVKHLKFIKE